VPPKLKHAIPVVILTACAAAAREALEAYVAKRKQAIGDGEP
jgi:hypothetical protein